MSLGRSNIVKVILIELMHVVDIGHIQGFRALNRWRLGSWGQTVTLLVVIVYLVLISVIHRESDSIFALILLKL